MEQQQGDDMAPCDPHSLKVGDYIVINQRPCKIVEQSTIKNGKHGAAKTTIVAIDIFNKRKYQDMFSGSMQAYEPIVKKTQCQIMDVNDEGRACAILENNNVLENIEFNDSIQEEQRNIEYFENHCAILTEALGISMITETKAMKQ